AMPVTMEYVRHLATTARAMDATIDIGAFEHGTPAVDAGTPPPVDGGTPGSDGGTPGTDGGTPRDGGGTHGDASTTDGGSGGTSGGGCCSVAPGADTRGGLALLVVACVALVVAARRRALNRGSQAGT